MTLFKNPRVLKFAGLALGICLVFVYAGSLLLGFTAILIRALEFLGTVGLPLAGAVCLAWFAYKLLLEPVRRRHKLERIRELRARRLVEQREEPTE